MAVSAMAEIEQVAGRLYRAYGFRRRDNRHWRACIAPDRHGRNIVRQSAQGFGHRRLGAHQDDAGNRLLAQATHRLFHGVPVERLQANDVDEIAALARHPVEPEQGRSRPVQCGVVADDPDRLLPAANQCPRGVVRLITELLQGLYHPRARVGPDARMVVDDARDGDMRDAGTSCNVEDARPEGGSE